MCKVSRLVCRNDLKSRPPPETVSLVLIKYRLKIE